MIGRNVNILSAYSLFKFKTELISVLSTILSHSALIVLRSRPRITPTHYTQQNKNKLLCKFTLCTFFGKDWNCSIDLELPENWCLSLSPFDILIDIAMYRANKITWLKVCGFYGGAGNWVNSAVVQENWRLRRFVLCCSLQNTAELNPWTLSSEHECYCWSPGITERYRGISFKSAGMVVHIVNCGHTCAQKYFPSEFLSLRITHKSRWGVEMHVTNKRTHPVWT